MPRYFSTSSDAIQPKPAATTACLYTGSHTSPHANMPGVEVRVDPFPYFLRDGGWDFIFRKNPSAGIKNAETQKFRGGINQCCAAYTGRLGVLVLRNEEECILPMDNITVF